MMKKLHILFAALCLVLAGACSNDDILEQTPGTPDTPENPDTPQAKGQRITIRATVDEAMGVKAGVDEGNTNYDAGETFYWSNGDQIKLIFVQVDEHNNENTHFDSRNPIPTVLFTAENAVDGAADFTGYIPQLTGTYNIYASSPKIEQEYVWVGYLGLDKDYYSNFRSSLEQNQTQTGKSSERLYTDGNMELWGIVGTGVEIVNGSLKDETLALSCDMEQLNAMLRFTITNAMDKAMTVKEIRVAHVFSSFYPNLFLSHSAILEYSSGVEKWACFYNDKWNAMSLAVEQKGNEATIASDGIFDAYMCALPTDGRTLAADGSLVVEVYLKDDKGNNYVRHGRIADGTSGFNFLFEGSKNGGLRAGTRYYFNIELNDDNTNTLSYSTWELYPSIYAPEGIVCEVNEDGTIGKIISVDETTKTWGQNGFLTGAFDEYDGEENTKFIKDLSIDTYLAFKWCVEKGSGWYLPAQDELYRFLRDGEQVDQLNEELKRREINTEFSGRYWTSTTGKNCYDVARTVEVGSSSVGDDFKTRFTPHYVRAMKKFDISPKTP